MRSFPRPLPAGVLLLAVLLGACGGGAPTSEGTSSPTPTPTATAAFPVTVTDDDGVDVTIGAQPERIVTFAPAATEILFELGLGDRIVGVSGPFDDFPQEATRIEHVGGASGVEPNLEKVVSLEPDLFITYGGQQGWKSRLRELDVTVFSVDSTSLEDLLDDIGAIGRVTGASAAAENLSQRMETEADEVGSAVADEPPVTCFFEVYYPPLSTVGPGTFIYDLLERAGCDPVTADATTQYPEWSVERLVQDAPEVYLVGSAPGLSAETIAERPGFGAIRAVEEGRVHVVDSDLVTRNGPRIVEGLRVIAAALHPEAVG